MTEFTIKPKTNKIRLFNRHLHGTVYKTVRLTVYSTIKSTMFSATLYVNQHHAKHGYRTFLASYTHLYRINANTKHRIHRSLTIIKPDRVRFSFYDSARVGMCYTDQLIKKKKLHVHEFWIPLFPHSTRLLLPLLLLLRAKKLITLGAATFDVQNVITRWKRSPTFTVSTPLCTLHFNTIMSQLDCFSFDNTEV